MSTYRASRGPAATTLRGPRRPTLRTLGLGVFAAVSLASSAVYAQSSEGNSTSAEREVRAAVGTNEGEAARPAATRPLLMTDGAMITDVADALDEGSTWSFRLGAQFVHSRRSALLQREVSTGSSLSMEELMRANNGLGVFRNVARYSHTQSRFDLNAELALWHDISLFFGVPIILADDRSFRAEGDPARANQTLGDGYSYGGTPGQLFTLPTMGEFASPTRAGVDYLRIGARMNLMNQNRDRHMPTWLLVLEYRAPVGAGMRPCYVPAGSTAPICPGNRTDNNPTFDPADSTNIAGDFSRPTPSGVSPGISRRVHGFFLQTILSRRVGYIEPYGGLEALVEVPTGAPRDMNGVPTELDGFNFGTNRPTGQVSAMPPIHGALVAGMEIFPWENRELWQRFGIDVRVRAEYRSPGRDYTPLFDALGSSSSYPLTYPTWGANDLGRTRAATYFTGTTTEQAHGRVGGQLGLSFIATKWLRFSLGTAFTYITPHLLTATDACNPSEPASGVSDSEYPSNSDTDRAARRGRYSGGCVGDATPDPLHRPVIDLPGQRFRFVEDFVFDLWINVQVTPRF